MEHGKNMRIGLISDVHATAAPLREALAVFRTQETDMILCAGDVAGYGTELTETVGLLRESSCVTVAGNHDRWYLERNTDVKETTHSAWFAGLADAWECERAGKRLCMVHGSPPCSLERGIRLLDERGAIIGAEEKRWAAVLETYPFDVLVVGHTHQVFARRLGGTLVINPGSTCFNHSCAILSLPDLDVTMIPLSGRDILPAWNWSMMVPDGNT
ncbi:MAG: hypothetical protein Kow0089_17430 [Desulfobulbaceae bacterium]